MGAVSFTKIVEGFSAKNCYEKLVEEAEFEKGHDSYNGTISTCSLGRCTKVFNEYKVDNVKKAYEFIESKGNGSKWIADYIDLGVKKYNVVTFKKRAEKYTAKYKLVYTVKKTYGSDEILFLSESKKVADSKAMELSLYNEDSYKVAKEYINQEQPNSNVVTIIEMDVKQTKKKPKLKISDNRRIYEIHEYIFYGWASM